MAIAPSGRGRPLGIALSASFLVLPALGPPPLRPAQGRPSRVQGRWRESTHGPTAQPNGRDHDSDEGEVSELDANAVQQQRERDVPLRQSRLAQPARGAQPMQETEAERNEPRLPLCRKRPSPLATGNPKTCACGIVYV